MRGRSFISGMLVGSMVTFATLGASADTLENLATTDVQTTYTFPVDGNPGVLSLNDAGLGVVATFLGGMAMPLANPVELTLTLELSGELGDQNDDLAHGQFGSGMLSMVDNAVGPPETVFEADISGFELVEDTVMTGFFVGRGLFSNAVYGGELSDVDMPTDGEIFTTLFSWFTGPGLDETTNIDNFLTSPNPVVYGEMSINLIPEPATLSLLSMAGWWLVRRRRR